MNASIGDSSSDDDEAPDLVLLFPASEPQPPDDTPTDGDPRSSVPVPLPPPSEATNTNTGETPLPPVPVTILTGFLGSGKTCLIRHILSSPDHGYRIAVIENEFGGGGADDTLAERAGLNVESMIARDGVTGSSLSDLIELPNGCVCCTVKDSLVETLENLIEKKTDIDYILIEASGMANPGPIASVFWLDEGLESRLRLDGVVACVDCLNILMQLKETSSHSSEGNEGGGGGGEEAAQQIAYADRILLNKTDMLSPHADGASACHSRKTHTLECVLEEIRSINPTAPVHATTYSKVPDLAWILDAKCFDAERVKDVDATFASGDIGNDEDDNNAEHVCTDDHCSDEGHDHSHSHHQHEHRHTSSVSTTALIQRGSVNLQRIHTWLAYLLWPDQDEDDAVLTARLQQLMQQDQETGVTLGSTTGTSNNMASNEMRIFRIKGILSVQHPCDDSSMPLDDEELDNTNGNHMDSNGLDDRRYIVQGVNDLWEIHPGSDSLRYTDGEERICKLIFIGRCLDRAKLLAGFEKCFC
eukprot:CAMPEP_0181056008 /NCGR_PEP_ID=MMETSP1070-20121207/19495_1 /TAXON_ID=265543 /ORGANISM="Minutocellus polymorphus, Strain NH13" /LENGTH=529 /DNA_ID=CAMNT_0023135341 /DNA_START=81 /DNA_END=1670 /DNA_ORIENTATION=+